MRATQRAIFRHATLAMMRRTGVIDKNVGAALFALLSVTERASYLQQAALALSQPGSVPTNDRQPVGPA